MAWIISLVVVAAVAGYLGALKGSEIGGKAALSVALRIISIYCEDDLSAPFVRIAGENAELDLTCEKGVLPDRVEIDWVEAKTGKVLKKEFVAINRKSNGAPYIKLSAPGSEIVSILVRRPANREGK